MIRPTFSPHSGAFSKALVTAHSLPQEKDLTNVDSGMVQSSLFSPALSMSAPLFFGSKFYLLHPKKPEYSPTEIETRKKQDLIAVKARSEMPTILQAIFPIPKDSRAVNAGHMVRIQNSLEQQDCYRDNPILQKALQTLLVTGTSPVLTAAENYYLNENSLLRESLDVFNEQPELASLAIEKVLPRIPKGENRDELITMFATLFKENDDKLTLLVPMLEGLLTSEAKRRLYTSLLLSTSLSGEGKAKILPQLERLEDDDLKSAILLPVLEQHALSDAERDRVVSVVCSIRDKSKMWKLLTEAAEKENWRGYIQALTLKVGKMEDILDNLDVERTVARTSKDLQGEDLERVINILALKLMHRPENTAQIIAEGGKYPFFPAVAKSLLGKLSQAPEPHEALIRFIEQIPDPTLQLQLINHALDVRVLIPAPQLTAMVANMPDETKTKWIDENLANSDIKVNHARERAAMTVAFSLKDTDEQHAYFTQFFQDYDQQQSLLQVLLELPGHTDKKFACVSTFVPDEPNSVEEELREDARKLLFTDFDESIKRYLFTSLLAHPGVGEDNLNMITLATSTIKNPKVRQTVIQQYEKEFERQNWTPVSTAVLNLVSDRPHPELEALSIPLSDWEVLALKPCTDLGLDLKGDNASLLKILKLLGRDGGELTNRLIPGFQEVLAHAKKYPDKLVPAGQALPKQEYIDSDFKSKALPILKAVALVGPGPVKFAIDQKKLVPFLKVVTRVGQNSEMFKPLYQANLLNNNVFNSIKLLELASSMIELNKKEDFLSALSPMVANGQFNIQTLGRAYLKALFESMRIPVEEVADGQLEKWDFNLISKLGVTLSSLSEDRKKQVIALCQASLRGKYQDYLYDPETAVGKVNNATKEAFRTTFADNKIELNYDQWMNYDGSVRFRKRTRGDAMLAVTQQFVSLYQELCVKQPTLKTQLDKVLETNKFKIENNQLRLNGQLVEEPYWLRSLVRDILTNNQPLLNEAESVDITFRAKLSNISHDAENSTNLPVTEPNYEIKRWRREPGFDLFQGNYTAACTALGGGGNDWASIQALQNTFIQMAHLKNEDTGLVVGKALFFWAKDNMTGKPILVLNTFEGRGGETSGLEGNREVRDQLTQYAKGYAKAVLGYNPPIYTSSSHLNPLYTSDLTKVSVNLRVTGSSTEDSYYLDTLKTSFTRIDIDYTVSLHVLAAGDPPPEKTLVAPIPESSPQPGASPIAAKLIAAGANINLEKPPTLAPIKEIKEKEIFLDPVLHKNLIAQGHEPDPFQSFNNGLHSPPPLQQKLCIVEEPFEKSEPPALISHANQANLILSLAAKITSLAKKTIGLAGMGKSTPAILMNSQTLLPNESTEAIDHEVAKTASESPKLDEPKLNKNG